MMMRTWPRIFPAAMLVLGAAYISGIACVNEVSDYRLLGLPWNFEAEYGLPFLPWLLHHSEERGQWVRIFWVVVILGIGLLTLIGIVMLLARRTSTATTFAVLVLLLALTTEATGIAHVSDLERMGVSRDHLWEIEQSLRARKAPFPESLAETSVAALTDGWGNAFRYQRIGDDEALIVAANRDGKFASVPQEHTESFPIADFDHDVILSLSHSAFSYLAYPEPPPAGVVIDNRLVQDDGCRIRSLFGCVTYW